MVVSSERLAIEVHGGMPRAILGRESLTPLGLGSRFGDKLLGFRLRCLFLDTAVLRKKG